MSAASLDSESSQSSSGYEDGLGRRVLAFDRETGDMLERLVLRPELSAFEQALRDSMAIVSTLEDERFTRPRAIERGADDRLTVISECVAGRRLGDILDAAADHGIVAGLDAGLGLLLELLPALARLHDAGLAHGVLAPGRVMITPAGQVVLLDSVYAKPLERLQLTRRRLWTEFRLAFPPTAGLARFDKTADLGHAAMVAAALSIGRPLRDDDYPEGIPALRQEILEIASIRGSKTFAEAVDRFFAGVLPLAGRRAAASADEAAIDLRKLVRKELGINTCRTALLEFFQQVESAEAERSTADAAEQEQRARAEAERVERERAAMARAEAERLDAERLAREEQARLDARRIDKERAEAVRLERERAAMARADAERVDAERLAREEQARLDATRIDKERAEAARLERERAEQARLETERLERERAEQARLEAARVERAEQARLEAERLERERLEAERLERERVEKARVEAERLARERAEAERRERERLEAERLERERAEKARLEAERLARERLEAERLEKERAKKARLEAERLERERAEQARLEAERLERERAEQARLEAERLEKERAEKARLEAERLEKERAEKARLEAERLKRERAEKARLEAERLERLDAERRERAEREAAENARLERERAERARLERERAEKARLEAERLACERLDAERREAELLEAARAERDRAEKARLESERLEQERVEHARLEAAHLERERAEQANLEAERDAERHEAQRLEAEHAEQARSEEIEIKPAATSWLIPPDRAAAFEPAVPQPPPPAPTARAYPIYVPPAEPAAWTSDLPQPPVPAPVIAPVGAAAPVAHFPVPAPASSAGSAPIKLKEDNRGQLATVPSRAEGRSEPSMISAEAYEPFATHETTRPVPWKLIAAGVVLVAATVAITRGYTPAAAPIIATVRKAVPAPAAPPPPAPGAGNAGRLTITTEPAGAKVLLDGKAAGESPLTLETVAPGRHVVTVVGSGGSVKRTVKVEAGRSMAIDLPLFSGFAAISAPIVLEVSENGKALGSSDDQVILWPGHHELRLANKDLGYAGTASVDIEPGEVTRVTLDPRGTANINAAPWAEVWIDGEKAGETPLANVAIRLGVREIVFKNPQYGERKVTITITASAPATVSVDFIK